MILWRWETGLSNRRQRKYVPAETTALCVIFTILVSFLRDNALFASKAKIKVVWNFSNGAASKWPAEWEKISNHIDFSLWSNRAITQKIFFYIFKWDQNHENHTLCRGESGDWCILYLPSLRHLSCFLKFLRTTTTALHCTMGEIGSKKWQVS